MKGSVTLALIGAALTVAACQSAPKAPAADLVAASYPLSGPMDANNAADRAWRDVLRDARLQRLVEMALVENRDLRLALLDAEEARAQLRVQRSNLLPGIDARGDVSRTRPGVGEDPQRIRSQASVGLAVTAFELDLFGRLRSQSQSAFQSWLAAEEGRNAARIVMISTVAEAYIAERAAEERLRLTEVTLADWQTSLRIAQQLREAGQNSGLEVSQAQGQVRTAEADLEAAKRGLQIATNALVLAVGRPLPDDLPAYMALAEQPVVTELAAGLPADLLVRRPDVRQAERLLAAANANVDAARAAFFPRISLTGLVGVASGDLNGLFNGGNNTWSFAPQITVPIFNAGRLQGELDIAKIRSDRAVAIYERTVQTAFREVADGLAGRATFANQIIALSGAVEAAERRAELSDLRYKAGVEGRLELLDAQRQLYAARLAMLSLREEQARSSIQLYRALGGGVA